MNSSDGFLICESYGITLLCFVGHHCKIFHSLAHLRCSNHGLSLAESSSWTGWAWWATWMTAQARTECFHVMGCGSPAENNTWDWRKGTAPGQADLTAYWDRSFLFCINFLPVLWVSLKISLAVSASGWGVNVISKIAVVKLKSQTGLLLRGGWNLC